MALSLLSTTLKAMEMDLRRLLFTWKEVLGAMAGLLLMSMNALSQDLKLVLVHLTITLRPIVMIQISTEMKLKTLYSLIGIGL